ncbi:MAG: hypothetical protein Q8941_03960 [Bacteroidota bacterium]|nr:hypothetical protein [Bacteroidota bacterium]
MKRLFYFLQAIFLLLFIVTFIPAILEFTGSSLLAKLNPSKPVYNNIESFNPSLQRLNSIKKLETYCDSIYEARNASGNFSQAEKDYPVIASEVVREKFYHGLSSFGFGNNYLGYLMNPRFAGMALNAPVLPGDIVKYPYGICSQQAAVFMNIVKDKGYLARKIGFYTPEISGHFCTEVFYRDGWHFFDTDIEPDMQVLSQYDHPGIKFLVDHPDIITKAYAKMDPVKVMALFSTYTYGKPDERLAPKAAIYQKVTKFLSYTIWILFLLAFIMSRRKYLRLSNRQYVRNRRVSVHHLQPG